MSVENDIRLSLLSQTEGSVGDNEKASMAVHCEPDVYNTLREYLVSNKDYYMHACISGIIWPTGKDNLKHSLTKYNLRYRVWAIYLHLTLTISTLGIIIFGFIALFDYNTDQSAVVLFCQTVGIVIQNLVLYPAVVYLRKIIDTKRSIDPDVYNTAFGESMIIGRRMRWFCMICLLAYATLVVTSLSSDDSSPLTIFIIIIYIILLTPTQYFLCGILTFLILEQRISLHTVRMLGNAVEKQELTRASYFEARNSIDERDRQTPISILIFYALINFVLSLILIFTFNESGIEMTTLSLIMYIFYVAVIFGKESVVIVILLLEIVHVNEKCDTITKNIARNEWGDTDTLEVKERQRLAVYAAVKEFPAGSTIFYIRPSKLQVTIQLLSMVAGAMAAVFWAFALKP